MEDERVSAEPEDDGWEEDTNCEEFSQPTHKDAGSNTVQEPVTFASARYWDDEYATLTPDAEPWEWYESYTSFRAVLLRHLAGAVRESGGLPPHSPAEDVDIKQHQHTDPSVSIDPDEMSRIRRLRVLVIGCGNSRLGEDLVDVDDFESVTCLDFSAHAIRHMQDKYSAKPQLKYVLGDATDMRSLFADESFDVVIDKGTFDALLCHPDVVRVVDSLLQEIERVTGEGGLYLCISQSDKRAFYFEDHFGGRARLRREAWAKAEESPMGHLNPVPFFHLYALSLHIK